MTDTAAPPSECERRYYEAQRLISDFQFATTRDTSELFIYDADSGIYKPAQTFVLEEAQRKLGHAATKKAKAEILQYIMDATRVDRSEFDNDPNELHFSNCWYNLETGQDTPHDPARLSISKIATTYDPDARCPRILRFLGQTLKPVDVFHFMQIAGYCLLPNNKFEKMFWWIGEGGNGKSVCAEILQHLVGHENWIAQSLSSLTNDKNAQARLFGKMLCVDHDTAEKVDLSETSALKKIISGNAMSVRGLYQNYFDMTPRTKLIVLTNSAPQFNTSNTYADRRRIDLMTFTKTVSVDDMDADLVDKLTTPEELSGFLNLALIGLRFLLREGWARSLSIHQMAAEFSRFGSSVRSYVDSRCILDDYGAKTVSQELYFDYLDWCKANSKTPETAKVFGGELAKLGVENRRRSVNGQRVHCYIGIKIRLPSADSATMARPGQQKIF